MPSDVDSAVAIVSKADMLAFLKITGATEDAIICTLVNASSKQINRYCGRAFATATYTEYLDGTGSSRLALKNFPVTTLTSLNDDVLRTWGAATAKDVAADVILDAASGVINLWNNGGAFSYGSANIKVVYVAGYDLTTMPYDVQLACKLLVGGYYKNAYAQWRRGIASEQTGDRNISFTNDPIPKDVADLLDPYKLSIGGNYD